MRHLFNIKNEHGLAIVEFTFTLPLLLFIMLASAEVGRLLYQYNTLTKATEDGARYLAGQYRIAITNGSLSAVTDNAVNLVQSGSTTLNQPSLLPGTIAVTPQTNGPTSNPIIITATYTYNPMILPDKLPGFGLWSDITLTIPLTAQVGMPIL